MNGTTRAITTLIVSTVAVVLLLAGLAGCDVISPTPPEEVVILGTKQIHELTTGTVTGTAWLVIDNGTVTRKILLGDVLTASLPAEFSELAVAGLTTFLGDLEVRADTAITGTLTVTDVVYLLGGLVVSEGDAELRDAIIYGDTAITGTLTVTDVVYLLNELVVSGDVTAEDSLFIADRLGLGTTTPADLFEVVEPNTGDGIYLKMRNSHSAGNDSVTIASVVSSDASALLNGTSFIRTTRQADGSADVTIFTGPGASGAPSLALTLDGSSKMVTFPGAVTMADQAILLVGNTAARNVAPYHQYAMQAQSNNWLLGASATKNHDHSSSTNPTIWVHSGVDVNSDNTQWLNLLHNQTDGRIATGVGDIQLASATGFVAVITGTEPVWDHSPTSAGFDGSVEVDGAFWADGAAAFDDNLTFTGSGAGLQHGYVWGNEITWTQASAAQNTWYAISDSGMTSGPLNGISHDGNGLITVTVAGMYMADWSGNFEAAATNIHMQIAFSVDGTPGEFGQNHIETIAVHRDQSASGTAILDLAAGQGVNVAVRTTDAGTPDLYVDHLHIRLVQIAGT